MIEVAVVDISAESRNRVAERICSLHTAATSKQPASPQINVKSYSLQELKFNSTPDICIIGCECLSKDLVEIATIRKLLPHTKLIAEINPQLESIVIAEQMARLGIDDTMHGAISPDDFLRKIVLLVKRKQQSKSGKLIVVDSGKGGSGVTSVVSGIGEACVLAGLRTVCVDLDFETQSLSRYLHVKPYLNENFQSLLTLERAVVPDAVMECATAIWEGEDLFRCVTAPSDIPDLGDHRSGALRAFLSFIEILDSLHDVVIVDIGKARGALKQSLYRAADKVLFVLHNDPAALFGAAQKINSALSVIGSSDDLRIIENASSKYGLPLRYLKSEICRAARIAPANWIQDAIPFCIKAGRWPGSERTMYGSGSKGVQAALRKAIEALGLAESAVSEALTVSPFSIKEALKKFLIVKERPLLSKNLDFNSQNTKTLPTPQLLITDSRVLPTNEAKMAQLFINESIIEETK